MWKALNLALSGAALFSRLALSQSPSALPIVDLGYELHQASTFNSTGAFYNFSNIRYAQPPVGDLRFRAPVPPHGRNTTVDNGSVGRICPQANPAWELIAAVFDPDYLEGKPFNLSATVAGLANQSGSLPSLDPRTTEDCLFLDVVVPQNILKSASNSMNLTSGAPVLVWIYGGGYTAGDKSAHSPAGLIRASQVNDTQGIIFVAMNYRLGALGWLAGPTLQSDGTANAGLYDQRLALQWVQDNIHIFGGDPNRVTVIGESAGGGSIMHQITAFGGLKGPAPFQRAVLQSAAFQNIVSNLQQETTFDAFLSLLNVSTIEEARQLPSSALIKANIIQVANSSYGENSFGPVVDGLFAPAIPGKLLLQGSYDHSLTLMLGHNADEGLLFTNPAIGNDTTFNTYLLSAFLTINPSVADYIENVLYPPTMPGTLGTTGYSDETGRVDLIISESTFTCNTFYLDKAFGNQTYAYQFSVPPALHGQDVAYTFFNGPSSSVVSVPIAVALQEYITSFAINGGQPSGPSLPMFPIYSNASDIIDLNATSITEIMDPIANSRCDWWQKELYV
ncbi:hypothetical protein HO173_006337 [Letharia columbiana]|uniref:Carboxylic ester hydrolase n=1 Tax=Letharia columbiana TaxID=112416 RepID=A0A8H6L4Y3_9LECA|nr:uncharacterized protein HO173_006337 [Letharia columbiana]KAF6235654.1 hypothetical protein HO173_006337 [Letharia columbiana]